MSKTTKARATGQGEAMPEQVQQEPRGPLFERFEWIEHERRAEERAPSCWATDLACATNDIASGVAVVVAMIERDLIDEGLADDKGEDLPKLLGNCDAGTLLRLAVRSLDMLAAESVRVLNHVQDMRDERQRVKP